MDADRHRAVRLYKEALSGLNGLFPAPVGASRSKIQFQLARLYNDEGFVAEASAIWKELIAQDAVPEIKRESLLRLAEMYENKVDYARAEDHYKKALDLCTGQDVCSYTHYRMAWIFMNAKSVWRMRFPK